MAKKLKVTIIIGARSDEYVSCLTIGEYVFSILNRKDYNVNTVRVTKDGEQWLFPKKAETILPKNLDEVNKNAYESLTIGAAIDRIKKEKTDVVFLSTPGGLGEDGSFQGLFQSAGIAYTSSGVMASALAMDKLRAAQVYAANGLRSPKTVSVTKTEWKQNPKAVEKMIKSKIGVPCFIKPSTNGSSIGAGPVKKWSDLKKQMDQTTAKNHVVLIQELIKGRELTCAVLDDGKNKPTVFTPTEIIPLVGEFYTYEAKHVLEHGMDEKNPPNLPKKTIKQIQDLALKAHQSLGCSGLSRTDFILSAKNVLYLLETNTIPGMTASSVYSRIVGKFGLTMDQFFRKILDSGLNRQI